MALTWRQRPGRRGAAALTRLLPYMLAARERALGHEALSVGQAAPYARHAPPNRCPAEKGRLYVTSVTATGR